MVPAADVGDLVGAACERRHDGLDGHHLVEEQQDPRVEEHARESLPFGHELAKELALAAGQVDGVLAHGHPTSVAGIGNFPSLGRLCSKLPRRVVRMTVKFRRVIKGTTL